MRRKLRYLDTVEVTDSSSVGPTTFFERLGTGSGDQPRAVRAKAVPRVHVYAPNDT